MADALPEVPPAFKPIQHYLKTAVEYEKRDPVVCYYCRLYAMQKGMEIDKKSPDCRNFLRVLMGNLEQMKAQLKDNEPVQSELVGQAHVENAALKLFFYADTEDRKSNFGKNVVKAFYTSAMLFDVLTTFGDLSEESEKSRKYAKWKAAYIHNCLKVGAIPQPGPLSEAAEELGIDAGYEFKNPENQAQTSNFPQSQPFNPPPMHMNDLPPAQPYFMNQPMSRVLPTNPSPLHFEPTNQPGYSLSNQPMNPPHNNYHPAQPVPIPRHNNFEAAPSNNAGFEMPPTTQAQGLKLKPDDYTKAMKYCKFANSAIQYEDAPTAILNLTKALKILTSGSEL